MAVRQAQSVFRNTFGLTRLYFSTSSSTKNKWRIMNGLEPNPNKYGPLNVLPDYSFVDGRPVPLSVKKVRKIQYQQELCKRIVELSHELDVGLQQYHERVERRKRRKEEIIKNKLKPKGAALLKKDNTKTTINDELI